MHDVPPRRVEYLVIDKLDLLPSRSFSVLRLSRWRCKQPISPGADVCWWLPLQPYPLDIKPKDQGQLDAMVSAQCQRNPAHPQVPPCPRSFPSASPHLPSPPTPRHPMWEGALLPTPFIGVVEQSRRSFGRVQLEAGAAAIGFRI